MDATDAVASRLGPSGSPRRSLLVDVASLISSGSGAHPALLVDAAENHAVESLIAAKAEGRDDDALKSAWTYLWRVMWELSGFDRGEPRPREWDHLVLPYRWLRHHQPERFPIYVPTSAEETLLEMLLTELGSLAGSTGHAADVRFPVVVSEHELLERYAELVLFSATASASFAPPRGESILTSRFINGARPPWRYAAETVAAMVTHESIHLHWADLWPRTRTFLSSPLHHALEEAATTVVEHLVRFRISQLPTEAYLGSLGDMVSDSGYPYEANRLLDVLYREHERDPWTEPELIWQLMSHVCTCPDEPGLVARLNEMVGVDHSLIWWRQEFPDPYLRRSAQGN